MLKKSRLLVLLLFVLILLAFLINNDFGLGSGEGEGLSNTPNPEESLGDTVIKGSETVERQDTTLAKPTPVVDSVSTEAEEAMTKVDTIADQPTTVLESDTLSADTLPQEMVEKEAISPYNTIKVYKKDSELIYEVNGETSDNLVALLVHLNTEKETLLKISGNITYAEEKEVKDILEVKEINFQESDF